MISSVAPSSKKSHLFNRDRKKKRIFIIRTRFALNSTNDTNKFTLTVKE